MRTTSCQWQIVPLRFQDPIYNFAKTCFKKHKLPHLCLDFGPTFPFYVFINHWSILVTNRTTVFHFFVIDIVGYIVAIRANHKSPFLPNKYFDVQIQTSEICFIEVRVMVMENPSISNTFFREKKFCPGYQSKKSRLFI